MAENNFPVCTHCGHTWGEYRARGLLGCPHCYVAFGDGLQADIGWLHRALALAIPEAAPAAAGPDPETLARWREQMAEAVRSENYEEAARIKVLLGASVTRGPGLGVA